MRAGIVAPEAFPGISPGRVYGQREPFVKSGRTRGDPTAVCERIERYELRRSETLTNDSVPGSNRRGFVLDRMLRGGWGGFAALSPYPPSLGGDPHA
jgi:hypothetical protein